MHSKAKHEEERVIIVFDLSEFSYNCMVYDVLSMLINIIQFKISSMWHWWLMLLLFSQPVGTLSKVGWTQLQIVARQHKVEFIKKPELLDHFDSYAMPEGFEQCGLSLA